MRLFIIIWFIFYAWAVFAQDNDLKFARFGPEQGISQSTINCICQDGRGFIWIGTEDGLNRYDGYSFKQYFPDSRDPSALSSNFILDICRDSLGNLWIGTNTGLNLYNRFTDNFLHYRHEPDDSTSLINNETRVLYTDKKGCLWIGTPSGLNQLIKDQKGNISFIRYFHEIGNRNSLTNNIILSILEDKSGNLWVGTDFGLNKLDKTTGHFINFFSDYGNSEKLWGEKISSLAEDASGNLWIGTLTGELNKYDPQKKTFTHYLFVTNNSIPNPINRLFVDHKKDLWVGAYSGLFRYLSNKDNFIKFTHDPLNLLSLGDNQILSFYEDKSNVLWIGSQGCLSKTDLRQKKFQHYKKNLLNSNSLINNGVWSIYEDHTGIVWIGTLDGLSRLDRKTGKFKNINYFSNKVNLKNNEVWAIHESKVGDLWIGTYGGGLCRFNPESEKVTNYLHHISNPNSIGSNIIRTIIEDLDSTIWIGTYDGGLNHLDPKNNSIKYYLADPNDPTSLSNSFVYCLLIDHLGILWVGTRDGLNMMNRKTKKFRQFKNIPDFPQSISNNFIRCLYEDKLGNIWIGNSGGLNKFNRIKETFISYKKADGLPNDVIYGILEDKKGNLWMSTNRGISKFNLRTQSFRNFDQSDGLQSNEFNGGAYFKNSKGEFYFGGINGFNVFHPDSIEDNTYCQPVVITDFQIFNRSIPIGELPNHRKILSESITETKEITLSYRDYFFSLEFASLHYANSENIKYAYKLDGFDEQWINTSSKKRFASYTNLRPGTYTFKIKATNSDGVWNDKPTQLKIIIIPPFWKSLWFYMLIFSIALALLIIFIKFRERQLHRAKKMLEETVRTRTMEIINQRDEIEHQRDEIESQRDYLSKQNDQIIFQNKELEMHRRNLENLVSERTVDLKKAKEKAEESDSLKTSFLANMSHEIRTPMNAIIGFSQLLSDPNLPVQQRIEFIRLINDSCQSLLILIDDILDISKIEANQIKIIKEDCDLYKLMQELFIYFKNLIDQKNYKLDLLIFNSMPDRNYSVITDAHRLKQILANLISNAIKYTDHGQIEFGCKLNDSENGQLIEFYVKDTGIGIPMEMQELVFDRFRKLQNEKKLYRGAGLGLAISKSLVKLLGGDIWLESQVNKGSSFFFTIPYQRGKYAGITTQSVLLSKPEPFNWESRIILIAEDDRINFKFLELGLKPTKIKILWAKNGLEAIEYFQSTPNIDMILMDIQMPEMDGLEATRIIKIMNPSIPIIAQTAFAMMEEKDIILTAGCDDYVSKPIKINQFLLKINNFLK